MVKKRVPFSHVQVVDSHTAGEPTRVVLSGGPDLGDHSLSARMRRFAEFHDDFRSAVVNEPRGSDVLVGALLCEPEHKDSAAGVIFFNNVGYLGMCGHGTIGLMTTLAHLGRITEGQHRIETPVGIVSATLHSDGKVTVQNVASYRYAKDVEVEVPGYGRVSGDVAWGGNWFFLVDTPAEQLRFSRTTELTEFTWAIREALCKGGVTGANNEEIDHIELSSPQVTAGTDSRNFVLCPGGAYDRSPCGTGTSAKIACLAADGKLAPGQIWRQEGILGMAFEGSYEWIDGQVIPSITGSAYVTGEGCLIMQPDDPFSSGIPR
jgi:4-hydroxyproline epimerase